MVGMAPLTKKHMLTVCNYMTDKGILKKTEPLDSRLQRTVCSLVNTWSKKHLKTTEEDWDKINVTEIDQTNNEDSDIVFVTCATHDDASKITSKARNLPVSNNKDDPRLIMYVDPRATKRYNVILNIAKTLKQKSENPLQTSIRNGKFDFLL